MEEEKRQALRPVMIGGKWDLARYEVMREIDLGDGDVLGNS